MKKGIHLYTMTHWEMSGKYYCNDVQNIGGKSDKWYTPMRILGLSVDEYIKLLVNTFHAVGLKYSDKTDCLVFSFNTEKEAKSFCAYVNKKAKLSKYYCS